MDDPERILERLVQLGDVIAVDEKKHAARVKFPATGIISGWLKVIDARPYAPDYDEELAETLDREPESEVVRWKENEDTDKEDLLYIETEAKGRIGFDLDSESEPEPELDEESDEEEEPEEEEEETEEESEGEGDDDEQERHIEQLSHTHEIKFRMWLPKIKDRVVCLYLPVRNGDGFILGKIW